MAGLLFGIARSMFPYLGTREYHRSRSVNSSKGGKRSVDVVRGDLLTSLWPLTAAGLEADYRGATLRGSFVSEETVFLYGCTTEYALVSGTALMASFPGDAYLSIKKVAVFRNYRGWNYDFG